MKNSLFIHADLRSRSQLKVVRLSFELRIRSISPLPLKGFRWCAEPITQLCRLKVKVTSEGHENEPWISFPLYVPFTPDGFSSNFGQMFASVRWCAKPITKTCWLSQGQNEAHKFELLILCPLNISLIPERIFINFWSDVRLSKAMCRAHDSTWCLKAKVTIEGHEFEISSSHISFTPGRIFIICSKVHLIKTVCKTCRLKVKVTV